MDGPIVLTQREWAEAISEALQLLACFSFFLCINLACAINIHAAQDGGHIFPPHPPSHAGGPWMDWCFSVSQFTHEYWVTFLKASFGLRARGPLESFEMEG